MMNICPEGFLFEKVSGETESRGLPMGAQAQLKWPSYCFRLLPEHCRTGLSSAAVPARHTHGTHTANTEGHPQAVLYLYGPISL